CRGKLSHQSVTLMMSHASTQAPPPMDPGPHATPATTQRSIMMDGVCVCLCVNVCVCLCVFVLPETERAQPTAWERERDGGVTLHKQSAHLRMKTHYFINPYIHTCVHTYMRTHKYMYTYTHVYTHAYMYTYIQSCIQTCMHAYIHTCICVI